jgi:hypothetical protein
VSALVDDAKLAIFQAFLKDNSSIYLGPYFDCDVEQQGELRIINGSYSFKPIRHDKWRVSWRFEVINRSHEMGRILFDYAEIIGTEINNLNSLAAALAIAVNENDL